MKRLLGAALMCVFAAGPGPSARAGEPEAKAIVDKAIKAVGGEERLSKVKAYSTRGRGTITFGGTDVDFTYEMTAQGLERYRSGFEGQADGNKFTGATVLDGDTGWRKFDQQVDKLEGEELADEKRNAYMEVAPVLLLPLKGPGFQLDTAGEEQIDGKPADVVRVTGPDGKDLAISFDRETGLPVRLRARVADFQGQEFDQDSTFEDYREFDGIKVATKSVTTRDGEKFVDAVGVEFKVLDEVPPGTFSEPK